jgi:hypothetical protein
VSAPQLLREAGEAGDVAVDPWLPDEGAALTARDPFEHPAGLERAEGLAQRHPAHAEQGR